MPNMDAVLKKTLGLIDTFGYSVIAVFPDDETGFPGFAYTVGLTAKGLPELIMTGLHHSQSQPLLRLAAEQQLEEGPFVIGNRYDRLIEGMDCAVTAVSEENQENLLRMAYAVMPPGKTLRALQVVWPDSQGRFPWEPGFEERFAQIQRLLGAVQ